MRSTEKTQMSMDAKEQTSSRNPLPKSYKEVNSPLMSIAKDPDSGVTTYMGITVDFYNYLAQHYNLT